MDAGVNANVIENDDDTFVTLNDYPMYEIDSQYPYQIINKRNGLPVRENNGKDGYIRIRLCGENELKHRVIAKQFLPNPEGLPCVDHKNHNRSDNRIENLRFVTSRENARNRASSNGIEYEFVDELEENAFQIKFVNGYEFKGYWLAGNEILYFDGQRYRVVIMHARGAQWVVRMRDVSEESRTVTKRQLDESMSEEYGLEFNI